MDTNKKKVTHIQKGVRKVLEIPGVYDLFHTLTGGNKQRERHFKQYFNLKAGSKVLDIGCGTGVLLKNLPDGVEYHGCDLEENYIEYLNEKFKGKGVFYCEKVGEVIREEWKGYFDVVNAHGLLHHLSNEDCDLLLETARLYLKEGGYLVTVDSAFHEGQSKVSKWLVSKDRGQNVRTAEGYDALAGRFYEKVDTELITNHLRIPYSIYVMAMYKQQNSDN